MIITESYSWGVNIKNIKFGYEVGSGDEIISCACGCGQKRNRYDNRGRERKYIHGHHDHNFKKCQHFSPKTEFKKGNIQPIDIELKRRQSLSFSRKGMKFTKEHCKNISKGKKGIKNPKIAVYLLGKTGKDSSHIGDIHSFGG